jgi:hypothetical protein
MKASRAMEAAIGKAFDGQFASRTGTEMAVVA